MEGRQRNVCPLLKHPEAYNPDSIDLINDENERSYWLPCLERMVKNFVHRASALNPDDPAATEKAELCYQKFHELVENILLDPTLLKPLSVRTLLEFNEDNLRDNNFKDAWRLQKEKESEGALREFNSRLLEIDAIENFYSKWLEIMRGVLAGNVFDWGSRAVADMLDACDTFGLKEGLETIEKRPWFHDDLDKWIERLQKQPYSKVVIFVDNAGVDFILGVLPLVRELLIHGTKVILAANTLPALNDLTYKELNLYVCTAAKSCTVLKNSINNGRLVTVANGQKGPCLDLSSLTQELCEFMSSADLVVLEGMGRAVHTNLYAKFKVDCVKVAVLKNEWLAQSLGAKQFSVIFNYEPAVV